VARIVQTHSTYLKGLLRKLDKLAEMNLIKTITPGKISTTKGKAEKLKLHMSTKTNSGYKLLARKGKLVQEVFVVTNIEAATLRNFLRIINDERN
tara:strand:- start:982 stop:1266 length:285 start_codon:yes stop_codon:yes gene_type:complete